MARCFAWTRSAAGYGGIFGPGYPGHSNHVHGDWRTTKAWSASQCF